MKYGVRNLTDGNAKTAWVEGKAGDGIGEFVEIEFDRPVEISGFSLVNGYGDIRYWHLNNRVKQLEIANEKGGVHLSQLRDVMETQQLALPQKTTFRKMILRINGIYRGSRDRDTCLSEVSIPGMQVRLKPASPADKNSLIGTWTLAKGESREMHAVTLKLYENGRCAVVHDYELVESGSEQVSSQNCRYIQEGAAIKVSGKLRGPFSWALIRSGDSLQVNSRETAFYFVQFGDSFVREN